MRTADQSLGRAVFRFATYELDAEQRSLFNGKESITLAPKAFDTLLLLIENAGKVLSKERLLTEIWEGSFVEENNLAQNISVLRKALGETKDLKFIETVPKFGYRFVANLIVGTGDVEEQKTSTITQARIYVTEGNEPVSGVSFGRHANDSRDANSYLPPMRPQTQYVQNGDVNIAYQVVGNGPIDLVFVMGWISHLEYFWKQHRFASFLERLASFSRLILFDKRGTGLSDRVPNDKLPTLEQRMEDVHAVMDAVGSERAVLIGVSEGGPMCSLFAATYPERTAALVMFGTYAKRLKDDDYPWAPSAEQRNAFFDVVKRDWGSAVGIEERAPSLADDKDFRDWWAEYLRMGASPGAAVALTRMNAEIDVRNVLPSVRVPTLVIHRTGDQCLKVEEGRYVADKIPGAKFVELAGVDHLPFVGDQEEILSEIEEFVANVRFGGIHDRILATVLNVTLLDNQRLVSDQDLAETTRESIRRKLDFFKGNEISYNNGQLLVTFDGPARAIRCATEIVDLASRSSLTVKAALHTGECDVIDGTYSGFAVELTKKIAEESEVGRILVSRTVKDLVAGSGLEFEELGRRSFDGIEGEWRMFAVK